jgi:hypothetical protein
MEGSTTFIIAAEAGGKIISAIEMPKQNPAQPIQRNPQGTQDMLYWGEDNLYPQTLNVWIEKHPILSSKLPWFAMALASGGIVYGTRSAEGFKPAFDPKIEAFNKAINLKRYQIDFPIEVVKFWTGFVELILSKDRSKIVNVIPQDSTFCRVTRTDSEKYKNNPQVFINANWDLGDLETNELTIQRPMLDPYTDRDAQVREGSEYAYIYPVMGPTSGRVGYSEAPWTSSIKSKWLQYSLAIPEAKLAKIENSMMVMYQIEVPDSYWKAAYPDWEEKKDLQTSRKKEKQTEWINSLTDKKNWGKAVMTTYKQFEDGKTGHHILIKIIENPFKGSELIEDSFEANSQIYQALMMDATLNGTIPGKQMGAGSGSDKREAWNLLMLSSKPLMDLILEPLQFVYDYNGFEYELMFNNYLIATQDQVNPKDRNQGNPNPANPAK